MNGATWSLFLSFPWAIAAGLLIAAVCAMFGVFVILKRVVFIGITLAEMAACGIAAAMLAALSPLLGAVLFTLLTVALLAAPFEERRIPRDAVMGALFVAASSLSVLLVSRSGFGLREVKSLLYGDLILASAADLRVLAAVLLPACAYLILMIRPTLYAFLDREASTVLGARPCRWELLFFVVLGLVVAVASKVAGALLVFCYLVAPSAAALLLSRRLGRVLALAAGLAVAATLGGLAASFRHDWPTNQTIGVATCAMPALAGLAAAGVRFLKPE
ncbi:MAG: metal ABC transporter permease [Verrucomicrobiota bacterium]|nr:metal ABC transporter permease [Verrucomicrobiota bacterium]